jgi:hypothetical protein
MSPIRKPALAVLASTATVLIALGVLAAFSLHTRLAWVDRSISAIEARYSRLQGVVEAAAPINDAAAQVAAQFSLFAFPATLESGLAATTLQQSVRQLADSVGVNIVTMQDLPPRTEDGFESLLVMMTATGPSESIHRFVLGLGGAQPRLFVDSATLGAAPARARGVSSGGDLIMRVTIGAYRLQS